MIGRLLTLPRDVLEEGQLNRWRAEMTHPLIAAALAMPKTHKVVATFADGTVHTHETRNEASARNYAEHMRFRGCVSAVVSKLEA